MRFVIVTCMSGAGKSTALKMLEDAGLRGYRVGGAQVSEKHCGFVINTGDATTSDVVQLIHDVQNIIWNKFKIKLEPEVKFLGNFTEGL